MNLQRLVNMRHLIAELCAVACLALAAAFLRQDRCIAVALVLFDRASLVGWAGLILLAAASSGMALLRLLRIKPARPGDAALFGAGTGLALVSLLTLLLGAVGLLGRVRLVLVILFLLALGRTDLGELLRSVPRALRRARSASAFRIALWAVLGFFLLLNLTRAFEPPWEYDVLEYHLAAPAAYHSAGKVFFIRDNVYANFPQNVEMLYLLCMSLTGSPDRGALAGQLLGAAMGFLAAMALSRMIAGLAAKESGTAAAALFYVWPGLTVYSGVAYVELPLIFYASLALWGLLWSWRRKRTRPGRTGWILLAAISTGAAMGVKYTAALLLFVPILAYILFIGLAGRWPKKRILALAALFAAVALLCLSPWLVRNFVNTRNPVYPLLYRIFGSSNWDARKDARWTQAHSPKDLSVGNFFRQTREALFFGERRASLSLILFVPLALLVPRRARGPAILLFLHALVSCALWFLFTQHNVRFLEIWAPALAGLSALGLAAALASPASAGLRPLVIILLLLEPARWVNYLNVERSLGVALGRVSTDEFFNGPAEIDFKVGYRAMQVINDRERLPDPVKVLFVGEARTFYCRRPYLANTVFDTNPLEEIVRAAQTPEDILRGLHDLGVTHIYLDSLERMRLQRSYAYSHDGKERPGMLEGFNWPLFLEFAKAHLHPVWRPPAAHPFDWEYYLRPEMFKPAGLPIVLAEVR